MKPASFDYQQPDTIDEAVDALANGQGQTTLLAGGQSLIPTMNARLAAPDTVVDINGLDQLDYVREGNGKVAIGALTRQSTAENSEIVAEKCPLLAEALTHVGHKPIRHRGTIGGNLAHADPNSELTVVSLVRDAIFEIQSPDGDRTIPAEDFFIGHMTTDMGPEELLTEVRFPVWPDGYGWAFEEMAPRKGDYAIAGVAAMLEIENGVCTDGRLGYTAVSDRPLRVPEAEEALIDQPPTEDTFVGVGETARTQIDPPSDFHGSSGYRKNLVKSLTDRALTRAAEPSEGS
mgnify:CR=1 FL=1